MPDVELVNVVEAASIAGVAVDRIGPMVEQGLLTAHFGDDHEVRFARIEVESLRHLGG